MSDKLDLIYKKMLLAKEELEKARPKMSDEFDPNEDPYDSAAEDDETKDLREFDPDEEDSSGADWLRENDPEMKAQGGDEYDEYGDNEDEEAHRRGIEEDLGSMDESPEMETSGAEAAGAKAQAKTPGQEEGVQPRTKNFFNKEDAQKIRSATDLDAAKRAALELVGKQPNAKSKNIDSAQRGINSAKSPKEIADMMQNFTNSYEDVKSKTSGRFAQPSREELNAMRSYTRPWEQRAREANALKADPSKNPELARHGNIVEARNQAHGDRNAAYRQLTSSDDYKNADPIAQMEMDDNFEKDWSSKNPQHLSNAMQSHSEAHKKGKGARDLHAANKDAQIRNILAGGGHGGEGYSLEEGMQHAGGQKGEEGTQATIKQDPASSFAMGNQDFIRQYADDYKNKGKKVGNIDDMMDYNEGSKRDINRILGEGPQKDPKFEKFFSHYYPLIGMNAHKTLGRLGLDPKHPDVDMSMLHEAGMHGLIQAMNDYDHDNPSKASFSTHAGNKIRGLQMTAMRNQDQIPSEVRQAQKKFAGNAAKPKVDLHNMIQTSNHPKAPDMGDRLKRVGAARATVLKRPAGTPKPAQPAMPAMHIDDEGEE